MGVTIFEAFREPGLMYWTAADAFDQYGPVFNRGSLEELYLELAAYMGGEPFELRIVGQRGTVMRQAQ